MDNPLRMNNKKYCPKTNSGRENGFTLLEMAIVILISGVLLSFMGSALLAYMKKSYITKTHFRIEKIQEALAQYLSVNGRYPCAAARTLGPEDANFGREVTTTCNAGTIAGTARNGGVRIGAVPTRSLNLPDDFIADAWGHKFTYAVTETLATPALYSPDGGRITIRDGAGLSLVTPPDTAHYVVVSHGATGDGSFPVGNSAVPSVACPAVGQTLDRENCNDDDTFIATLVNSDAAAANFFDDYAAFKGQTAPVFVIPQGAVFAFNLSDCPPGGWSEVVAAQGRFIVGAQAAPRPATRYQIPISNPIETADMDMTLGSAQDGDAPAVIPPYVALLYCQKD